MINTILNNEIDESKIKKSKPKRKDTEKKENKELHLQPITNRKDVDKAENKNTKRELKQKVEVLDQIPPKTCD